MSLETWKCPFRVVAAVLLFLCLGLYFPSLKAEFILDDHYTIVRNPFVKQPALYPQIWTRYTYAPLVKQEETRVVYYRPLMVLSFAVNYQMSGLNPFYFRLTNLFLHFLNSVLVYVLLKRLFQNSLNFPQGFSAEPFSGTLETPRRGVSALGVRPFLVPPESKAPAEPHARKGLTTSGFRCRLNPFKDVKSFLGRESYPFLSAVFFCILPVHEWVVNNITARADLLEQLFLLLSVISLTAYWEKARRRFLVLSLLFFASAILSRELALLFPLLVLLCGWVYFKDLRRALPSAGLFFIVAAGYFLLRQQFLPVSGADVFAFPKSYLWEILTWGEVAVSYLTRFLAPWVVQSFVLGELKMSVWKLILLIPAYGWGVWWLFKKSDKAQRACLFFASLWIFINFLPFGKMVPQFVVNGPILSEHYLYLATVGFSLLLVMVCSLLPGRWKTAALAGWLVYFGGVTFYNNTRWTTEEAYLKHLKKLEGSSGTATASQVLIRYDTQEEELRAQILEASSLEKKGYWTAVLGRLLMKQKNYEQAGMLFKESLALSPTDAEVAHEWGLAALQIGDRLQARRAFEAALKINPLLPEAYFQLGMMAFEEKEWPAALENFEQAAFYDPENAEAYLYAAVIHLVKKDEKNFYRLLEKVFSKKFSAQSQALLRLLAGEMYAAGFVGQAMGLLEEESRSARQDPDTLVLLGKMYFNVGKEDRALEVWQAVLKFEPEHQEARECLQQARPDKL